jgi:glycosyltransferase involved in cell wall biosynthesis
MIPVALDVSALDPNFKGHAQRGIGRYVSELKKYFDSHQDDEVTISYFNHKDLLTTGLAGTLVNALPVGRTTVRQQFLYPFRLQSGSLKSQQFVHFPAHMDAPAWSRKPYILTVLDLIPLVLKDLYKANRSGPRFHFARWLEITSIRHASLLIAISEHTAQDIVRVLGIPRERIVVTPLGVDASFSTIAELRRRKSAGDLQVIEQGKLLRDTLNIPQGRPILLYVGGHDERKNIERLIHIAREVISHHTGSPKVACPSENNNSPILVLAGRVGSEQEASRLQSAITQHGMQNDCVSLGYVPDEDLRNLYCESELFLFPSLYEGFGLPPLEAMAAGLPVVCSSASSLPEVVGDCGVLFDPVSVEDGVRGVLSILKDSQKAATLSENAERRARQFTWERTGRATVEAYTFAASRSHIPCDQILELKRAAE